MSNEVIKGTDYQWFDGLSKMDLDTLSGIAGEVNETMEKTVKVIAQSKMKIGDLLNSAREMFPGDKEFGKWRAATFPDVSPTECSYCQKLAVTFSSSDKMIEKVGWSTLRELTYAPAFLLKRLESGEQKPPANKADARQMVKTAKAEEKHDIEDAEYEEVTGTEGISAEGRAIEHNIATSPPPAEEKPFNVVKIGITKYPMLSPEQKMSYYTSLPLEERVKRRAEYDDDPYILLGLPADTETMIVSDEILAFMKESWKHAYPDQFPEIKEAIEDIMLMIGPKLKMVSTEKVAERIIAQREIE